LAVCVVSGGFGTSAVSRPIPSAIPPPRGVRLNLVLGSISGVSVSQSRLEKRGFVGRIPCDQAKNRVFMLKMSRGSPLFLGH
jgi:hypothetical protein